MDKSKQTQPPCDALQQEEARRQARRRLLKTGALAAPLVLTFKGSSALAQVALSGGGCVVGNGTDPVADLNLNTPVLEGQVITNQTGLTSSDLTALVDNGNISASCSTSIMTVTTGG